MRIQRLTYLIAGVLMAILGTCFALIFAYRFNHFGWDLITPYRILIAGVPTVLGGLFIWRSGTLWSDLKISGSAAAREFALRSDTNRNAKRLPHDPDRFLCVGLLFATASSMIAARLPASAHQTEQHSIALGLAGASILALAAALLRIREAAHPFIWIAIVFDVLLILACW